MYVETLGNALFAPFVLEYAPKPERIRQIIARLQKVNLYLDQASTNLVSAPDVWTQVAIEENQGNIALVDKEIRAGVPADQSENYARAARPALDAMIKFDKYLKNSLSPRNDYDWRLGGNLYSRKFRYALHERNRSRQYPAAGRDATSPRSAPACSNSPCRCTAKPFPATRTTPISPATSAKTPSSAKCWPKSPTAIPPAKATWTMPAKISTKPAPSCEEKHLLTLPSRSNLQVIPTPGFMRGSYPVGGFNAAPALEPQLGAFYWVTPIPPSWPAERAESKLREYNFYKLKLLTLHEAMPGHYVQLEFANDVQPKSRRAAPLHVR